MTLHSFTQETPAEKPVAVVVGQQKNEDPWAGFYACLAGDWRGRTSTLVIQKSGPRSQL